MKLLLLFVVIITIYDVKTLNPETEILNHITNVKAMFTEIVKEKCYPHSKENVRQFKELLDNSTVCMLMTYQNNPIFVTPLNTLKHHIQNCLNDVIEELEECLPEESKYLPQLDLDTFFALLEFVYENKAQLFSPEILNYVQTCAETVKKQKAEEKFLECVNFKLGSSELKAACLEIRNWERCLMVQINNICPPTEEVEKLRVSFLKALKEACTEHSSTENSVENVFTLLAPYAPANINPDLM